MRFGVHVSISGGIVKGADQAIRTGCESLQIFSGNPTGWRASALDPAIAQKYAGLLREHDIGPTIIHTQYLINLAATKPENYERSIGLVADALRKAGSIGNAYVNTHIGSHLGEGVDAGIEKVVAALIRIFSEVENESVLLLENTPGSGNELGQSPEEFAQILHAPELQQFRHRLGICLDTAHLWGAGYDIATCEGVQATFAAFKAACGAGSLRCLHANDSTTVLNSHHDVHAIPGEGLIGMECFRALVNIPQLAGLPCIIEMRTDDDQVIRDTLDKMRSLQEGGESLAHN